MVETDDVEQQQQQQQHQYGYDTGVAVGGGEQFYLAYSYFDEDEMVVRPLQFLDAHLAATFAPNDFYEDEYNNNNGWGEDGSSTGVNEQSAGQNGDEPGWFKQAREADAASIAATRQSVIKRTWDYALPADMPIEVTCKQCQQSAGMYPARHVCYQPNDETPILHSQNEDRTTDVVAVTDRGVAGAQPQLVFRPSISSPVQSTQDEQSALPQVDEQLAQQHYNQQQHYQHQQQQQHYVETTPDAANVSSNNGWDDLAESVMEQPASATAQTPTGELTAKPSKNKKNRYAMHGNTTYAVQDSSKRKSMMPQSAKANKRITILDTSRPIDGKLVPVPSKLQRKVTDNSEETKQKSGNKKKKPQIWDAFVDKIVPQSMKKSNNRVSLAVQQYYKEQGEELPDWYNDLVNAEEEELKSKLQAQQDSTATTAAAPVRPPREMRTPASTVQHQPAPLHQLQQQLHHQQQQQQQW